MQKAEQAKGVAKITSGIKKYLYRHEIKGKLLSGSAGGFAVRIGAALLSFLVHFVMARTLGVTGYGTYIYAMTWTNVLVLVGTLGFTTASNRFIATYAGNGQWGLLRGYMHFSRMRAWCASLGLACCMALLVYLLAEDTSMRRTFWAACLLLPVLTLLTLRAAEVQGLKHIVRAHFPKDILRQGLLVLGVLLLIDVGHVGARPEVAMLIHFGATLLAGCLLLYFFHQVRPPQQKKVAAQYDRKFWSSTAFYMLLATGFNLLLVRADILMVGALIGPEEAGIYAIASKLATLLTFVLIAVNGILGPISAELYGKKDIDELQQIVLLGARIAGAAGLLIGCILWFWDDELLRLFGEDFVVASPILHLLIIAQVLNLIAGPVILLLNMTEYHRTAARIVGVSAIINIILNAILILWIGTYGAAVATTITMVIWNGAGVWSLRKKTGIISFPLCCLFR